MLTVFITFCVTTAIAMVSVCSAKHAALQRRAQPWIGGLLLVIGLFWILPEIAEDRGWISSLCGIAAGVVCLALIDRYVCPICPFCAVPTHCGSAGHACGVQYPPGLAWPLLSAGCVHSFLDGWTIGLSQVASPAHACAALSWGAFVHKIPESVAIGFVAAQWTASRPRSIGIVLLIQTAMFGGGTLAVSTSGLGNAGLSAFGIPACSCLLFFGLLALRDEWHLRARLRALHPLL